MGKILLIEDDLDIQGLIKTYLEQAGFEVITTASPIKGLEIIKENRSEIELIILDLGLPQMDGLEFCKKVRQDSKIPIIISSARINALLRRLKPKESVFGALRIDVQKREVYLSGALVDLTNTEFDILALLIENRLHPISRESIANTISTIHDDSSLRNVDTHIRNLRIKLNDNAKEPKFLQSVWGIGYKFCL